MLVAVTEGVNACPVGNQGGFPVVLRESLGTPEEKIIVFGVIGGLRGIGLYMLTATAAAGYP